MGTFELNAAERTLDSSSPSCMKHFKGIEWLRKTSILSPVCIHKYFIEGDFSDLQCFLSIICRLFGYLMVFSSGLVKVPQIITIWAERDARGISILSELLMLCSIFGNLVDGFTNQLPLPSYGDSYFLFLHTVVIVLLIMRYGSSANLIQSYQPYLSWIFALFCSFACILLFKGCLPIILISTFVKISIALAVLSRLWQVYVNWTNRSTGQLSTLSTILLLLISFVRIFTSINESNNRSVLSSSLLTVLNVILLYQLGYYWNEPHQAQQYRQNSEVTATEARTSPLRSLDDVDNGGDAITRRIVYDQIKPSLQEKDL